MLGFAAFVVLAVLARRTDRDMEAATASLDRGLTDVGEYVGGRDRGAERRERLMVRLTGVSVAVSFAALLVAILT